MAENNENISVTRKIQKKICLYCYYLRPFNVATLRYDKDKYSKKNI